MDNNKQQPTWQQTRVLESERSGLKPISQILFQIKGVFNESRICDSISGMLKRHPALDAGYGPAIFDGDRQLAYDRLNRARDNAKGHRIFAADVIRCECETWI